MSTDLEEFRQRILTHAKLATSRAPKVESEASTNTSLVQPFLTALGYDVGNPEEVAPEHHADFSEKYQNKVDYAILHQGTPVIALESKRVGAAMKDDRGQLRSYFNACPTVKLGILTDGLRYEFYADSDKPNMMDEVAFLRLDFIEIAKEGNIDDNTLGGIAAIRHGLFNPEDVGAEAKRKLLLESIIEIIKQFKTEPSDDFIRFILGRPEVDSKFSKLTQKIVDANRDIVRSAMEAFVAQEALARFGYAPKDVVRATPERSEPTVVASTAAPEAESEAFAPSDSELGVLNYVTNRLFYLVRNDVLFQQVQKIAFRKTKTSFRVYYGKLNSGSLFDFRQHKDGKITLQFPALGGEDIPYVFSPELDDFLIRSFTKRVTDAGISFDSQPVLRTIKGGQSESASK
jgi:hypothetical protein